MKRSILYGLAAALISIGSVYGESEPWRFAVIGDTHVPQSHLVERIVDDLLKQQIEVVLFPGDLVQGGKGQQADGMEAELDEWLRLVQPLRDAGIEVLAVRGNHEADVRGDNLSPWIGAVGPDLNVSLRHRNVTFIGLDNYLCGERTVDTVWLEKALQQAAGTLIVPFGHEPAFTCGTFHPVCLDADTLCRNRFWKLLETYGVPYYFCGHAHQYNLCRITHDGHTTFQVVSGGGGGRLQPRRGEPRESDYCVEALDCRSENGYLVVEVNGSELSTRWCHVQNDEPQPTGMRPRKGEEFNTKRFRGPN